MLLLGALLQIDIRVSDDTKLLCEQQTESFRLLGNVVFNSTPCTFSGIIDGNFFALSFDIDQSFSFDNATITNAELSTRVPMKSAYSQYYNVSFKSLVNNIFDSSEFDIFRQVDVMVTNGGLAESLYNSSIEELHIVCSLFTVLSQNHYCVSQDTRNSSLVNVWINMSIELSHSSMQNLMIAGVSNKLLYSLLSNVNVNVQKGKIYVSSSLTLFQLSYFVNNVSDSSLINCSVQGQVSHNFTFQLTGYFICDSVFANFLNHSFVSNLTIAIQALNSFSGNISMKLYRYGIISQSLNNNFSNVVINAIYSVNFGISESIIFGYFIGDSQNDQMSFIQVKIVSNSSFDNVQNAFVGLIGTVNSSVISKVTLKVDHNISSSRKDSYDIVMVVLAGAFVATSQNSSFALILVQAHFIVFSLNYTNYSLGSFVGQLSYSIVSSVTVYNSSLLLLCPNATNNLGGFVGYLENSTVEQIYLANFTLIFENNTSENSTIFIGGVAGTMVHAIVNNISLIGNITAKNVAKNNIGYLTGLRQGRFHLFEHVYHITYTGNYKLYTYGQNNNEEVPNFYGQMYISCDQDDDGIQPHQHCVNLSQIQSDDMWIKLSGNWRYDSKINRNYIFSINSFILDFADKDDIHFIDGSVITLNDFLIDKNFIFPISPFDHCVGICRGYFISVLNIVCDADNAVYDPLTWCRITTPICAANELFYSNQCHHQRECQPKCNSNGFCLQDVDYLLNETITCDCSENYTGGVCQYCTNGLFGPDCDLELQNCSESLCGRRGNCTNDMTNLCLCEQQFSGSNCDSCSNLNFDFLSNCSRCRLGFFGDDCEYSSENCQLLRCNDRGDCRYNEQLRTYCECQIQFSGEFCEFCAPEVFGRNCNMTADECSQTLCSDHGSCQKIQNADICDCAEEFTGMFCDSCSNESLVYEDGCLSEEDDDEEDTVDNTLTIVLGVLGGLVALALIIVVAVVVIKRQKKKAAVNNNEAENDILAENEI